jgi:hypothetical protein
MRTFAFRGRYGQIALTPISDGGNLPSRDGPWRYWKPVELAVVSKEVVLGDAGDRRQSGES